MAFNIRPIQPADNSALATIIRDTLTEFGANRPGTVFDDPTTDALYALFQQKGAAYFTALSGDKIIGGGGIFPTDGLLENTCELVKMYLLPEGRGAGLGRQIIETCLETAREKGYEQVYLETMPELIKAMKVYERFGFGYLDGPMGNSGHTGCSLWMLKKLS